MSDAYPIHWDNILLPSIFYIISNTITAFGLCTECYCTIFKHHALTTWLMNAANDSQDDTVWVWAKYDSERDSSKSNDLSIFRKDADGGMGGDASGTEKISLLWKNQHSCKKKKKKKQGGGITGTVWRISISLPSVLPPTKISSTWNFRRKMQAVFCHVMSHSFIDTYGHSVGSAT